MPRPTGAADAEERSGKGVVDGPLHAWPLAAESQRAQVALIRPGAATTFHDDPKVIAEVSRGLGEAMVGINVSDLPAPHRLAERGW